MKPETIKAIFTNLLFVIGVVLLIVGFVQGTRTAVKMLTFETYPLDSWEETKCDQPPYIDTPVATDTTKPLPITRDTSNEQTKLECRTQIERERRVRKTEDIVGAVTMLVSGSVLVFFFRKYILK